MKKKLVLRSESLTELSASDLSHVVGGTVKSRAFCATGITVCKGCEDLFPTVHNGCTPTPDA